MTLAALDAPLSTSPEVPRQAIWTGAPPEPLPELTEEQWTRIQARLAATGLPEEPRDDRATARMLGTAFLLGLALTGLAACGLWSLFA